MKIQIKAEDIYTSFNPAKEGDAGFDLRTLRDFTINPGQVINVPTGFRIAIPKGIVGMVCSRSGLASKQSIACLNSPGIIDSGYRGEIHATLINLGKDTVSFKKGDRIAQLLLVNHIMDSTEFIQVEDLGETERGEKGFGSTGK